MQYLDDEELSRFDELGNFIQEFVYTSLWEVEAMYLQPPKKI